MFSSLHLPAGTASIASGGHGVGSRQRVCSTVGAVCVVDTQSCVSALIAVCGGHRKVFVRITSSGFGGCYVWLMLVTMRDLARKLLCEFWLFSSCWSALGDGLQSIAAA